MYKINFMKLPYKFSALQPYISKETIETHYKTHYLNCIKNIYQTLGIQYYHYLSLNMIIKSKLMNQEYIYQNILEIFNHNFYWQSMLPKGESSIQKTTHQILIDNFMSIDNFIYLFSQACISHKGAGWVWLVKRKNKLIILTTNNNSSIISNKHIPILACDVWEHAYYLDYNNNKKYYIQAWINLINWNFIEKNLSNYTFRL